MNAWPEFTNNNNYTDIALDDINFINCSPAQPLIDMPLDCDFEIDFCYYSKDKSSDFEWVRDKGSQFSFTGPIFDHTSGNGYFALMPSSSNPQNTKARFYSTLQTTRNEDKCLRFWYLMFGTDVDSLNVYLDQYDSSENSTLVSRMLIWKKYGTSARRWYEVKKTFDSNKPWRITFEGVVGKSFLGDIAIDDISAEKGVFYLLRIILKQICLA